MEVRRQMVRVLTVVLAAALLVSIGTAVRAEPLERVESKRVCMVNDTVFPRDQIPVDVDGKTYFGCCEMCKGRLAKDASVRSATDPVTGKSVDKATAIIGAGPDGKVQYFESEETFSRFGKGA